MSFKIAKGRKVWATGQDSSLREMDELDARVNQKVVDRCWQGLRGKDSGRFGRL